MVAQRCVFRSVNLEKTHKHFGKEKIASDVSKSLKYELSKWSLVVVYRIYIYPV